MTPEPTSSSPPPAASTADPVLDDDLPIALRKGVSVFIQFPHFAPITSCLLSPAFIAFLDSILLPNTFQEALSHLGWRSVMRKEMDALNGNGTWNLVHYLLGRKSLDVVGSLQSKLIQMVQLPD